MTTVEQVRSRVPYVAHVVDAELISGTVFFDEDVTLIGRLTNLHEAYTCVFEYLLHFVLVLVGYLNNDTRVFGKQYLDEVVFLNLVEADFHTAFYVGEAHFEQRGDETACRDVVSGQDEAFVHQFLNGEEGVAEVFGILYGRYVVADFAQ